MTRYPRKIILEGNDSEPTNLGKYAIYQALSLVMGGLVGGLSLAIALMLQAPIMDLVRTLEIENENLNILIAILIFFVIIIGILILSIPISKKLNEYKPAPK